MAHRVRQYLFVRLLFASIFLPVPVNRAHELSCQPEGKVTSISGSGIPGFRDGQGEKSHFSSPAGVAVSSDGSVYVADSGNNRIRRVSSKGHVTWIAGSGLAGFSDDKLLRAEFNRPQGIVTIPTGLIFVADTLNHRIRLVSLHEGLVSTYAGSGIATYRDAPVATQACIRGPVGLAYHSFSGDLFISDTDSRIRVVRQVGIVETVLNGAGIAGYLDAIGIRAMFNRPSHMTLNEDESILYVADRANNRIRQVDLPTMTVTTITDSESPSQDAGTLAWNESFPPESQRGIYFDEPFGIAFYTEPAKVGEDAKKLFPKRASVLLVSELRSHRLRRLVLVGDVSGSGQAGPASFMYAGSYNAVSGHVDELGPASMFHSPSGISVVPGTDGGVAFVADAGNHMIRRVEKELPKQLYISVKSNLHPNTFEDVDEYSFGNGNMAISHGYYSINGPPNNETSHAFGFVSYSDETHVLTMCAYPSLEYFVIFKGPIHVIISDVFHQVKGNVYISWKGTGPGDERAETFRLKDEGCTNPSAPNYNAWAIHDDGSCVHGTRVVFEVNPNGQWASYQLEGPGFYYGDIVGPANEGDYPEDADGHIIEFTAWPQVIYTVHLHGTARALMSDAAGQTTSFNYFNFSSVDASSQHLEAVRPAGPGCTKSDFVNYSPFATIEDNSCVEGRWLQVDMFSAFFASTDWYSYGHIALFQPLVLGGQATFPSKLFLSANITAQAYLFVSPGIFPLKIFGNARVQITLNDTGDLLISADGSDYSHMIDSYGFASTLGETLFHFSVPEKSIQRQVVSSEGGVIGNYKAGSIIIGSAALESPTVVGIDVAAVEGLQSATSFIESWRLAGKIFQMTPLRLRLASPVTVIIPYDEQMLPTILGNDEAVVIGASDKSGVDWRVMPGASFGASKVHVDVDKFSLLAVATRPDVKMILPQRARLSGGTSITLIGNNLCSASYSKVLCKFGNDFHNAQIKGECSLESKVIICQTPQVAKAGFVSVDVHDASTLQSSQSGIQILFTSGEKISNISPDAGPWTGGAFVMVVGMHFNFVIDHSHTNRMGDLYASAAREADPIYCYFDSLRPSNGFAISSVLAVCELPPAPLSYDQVYIRVALSPHDETDGSFAAFKYRMPLTQSIKLMGADGSHIHHNSQAEPERAMLTKMQTISCSRIDQQVVVPEAYVLCGSYLDPAIQCRFGTLTVEPLVLRVGVLQCRPPFMSSEHSVMMGKCIAAPSLSITGIVGEPATEFTHSMRPAVLHTLTESKTVYSDSQYCTFCSGSFHGMPFEMGYAPVDILQADKHSLITPDLLQNPELFEIHGDSGFVMTSLKGGGVSGADGGGLVWLSGSSLGRYSSSVVRDQVGSLFSAYHFWCEFGPVSDTQVAHRIDAGLVECEARKYSVDMNTSERCDSRQMSAAHAVSSALFVCEGPLLSNSHSTPNITQDESFFVSVSLRSNGDGYSSNGNFLPLLLVPEPLLESVSLNHTQSRVGGGAINLSWQLPHDRLLSVGTRWFACAFGTIAPVNLVLHGKKSATSGTGLCLISPHAHCFNEARQSYIGSSVDCKTQVWVYLPCTGRAKSENQHFIHQKDLFPSRQAFVTYTPRDKFSTMPCSSRNTGLASSDWNELLHITTSSNPYTFLIVDVRTLPSTVKFANTHDIRFKVSGENTPVIVNVSPSQITLHGHAILRLFGSNFWSPDEHGGLALLYCSIGTSRTIITVVSSVYALCESPALHSLLATKPTDVWQYERKRVHLEGKLYRGDIHPASFKAFSNNFPALVDIRITSKHGICVSEGGSHGLAASLRPCVSSTTPVRAFANYGGSIITVPGQHFSRSAWHSTCRFGTTYVSANIMTATLATCVTPARAKGIVQFAFFANGVRSLDRLPLNFTFT